MAKKSRTRIRPDSDRVAEAGPAGEADAVGPRQPCPCGSGKRYKNCHGGRDGGADVFVARPFDGLPGECDVVAMRELVPAATAPLRIADGVAGGGRDVLLCTLLPGFAPAMVREDGTVRLGLQVQHQYGDPARDLGAVLVRALAHAEAGEPGVVGLSSAPGPGPRLQDLLTGESLEVSVHDGYEFWIDDVDEDERADLAESLERANGVASPTVRLPGVEAAYWTHVGTKEHLRWVRPEPEDQLLDALARLHVSGADVLVPEARLVGMFRAHGLLVPVWDLAVGTGAEALTEPVAGFGRALEESMASATPLTSQERAARSGLANRQVTIR